MSESPLYRRQLVKSGVDTAAAALANEVLTVGDDYAAVGKIIGKLFEQGAKNKEEVDKAEEQEKQASQQILDNITDQAYQDQEDQELADLEDSILDAEVTDLFNSTDPSDLANGDVDIKKPITPKTQTYTYEMLSADAKQEFLKKNPGKMEEAHAYATEIVKKAEKFNEAKYKTQNPTAEVGSVNNIVDPEFLDGIYQPGSAIGKPRIKGSTTRGSAGVKELNMNRLTPLNRTASAASLLAGMEARQMGMGSTFNSKISDKSQYVKGKTYVEKEQYLRVPSYLQGTSGAAALEGFNIGIEADNYRKQVEADLADFREDKWKGLVQEAQQESLMDKSTVAMLKQYKSQFADAMKSDDPGKRIESLTNIKSGMANVYQADAAKTKLIEGLKARMSTAAFDLESPQAKDEILSIANGKNIGMIVGEDGQIYLAGQTNGGMPYRKKLSDLVSGEGLPKFAQKADTFGIIDGIADSIEKQKLFRETVDADGIIRKVPLSKEELKQQFDFEFEQAINDNGVKSLAASLPMYQGPRAYQRWQAGEGRPSDDPFNNRNVLKQAMTDMLHHRLSGYMSQITEEESKGGLAQLKSQLKMKEQIQKSALDQQADIAKEKRKAATSGKGTAADFKETAKFLLTGGQQGSLETITQEGSIEEGFFGDKETTEAPQTTGEQAFTYYPNLDNLQGKGIASVEQSNGRLTIYGKQSIKETNGKESVTTNILESIDLTQPREKLMQDLENLAREYNIVYKTPGTKFNATEYIDNYNKGKSN